MQRLEYSQAAAAAAEGKLLLRKVGGPASDSGASTNGQQLIRAGRSSSDEAEIEVNRETTATRAQLAAALAAASDLQQRLCVTEATLTSKEQLMEQLQQQLADASAAAAKQAAAHVAKLSTLQSETRQLKDIRDKLESMLADFESEAAAAQSKLTEQLTEAETRAAEAEGQLQQTRACLVEAQQQLEEVEQVQQQQQSAAAAGHSTVSSTERGARSRRRRQRHNTLGSKTFFQCGANGSGGFPLLLPHDGVFSLSHLPPQELQFHTSLPPPPCSIHPRSKPATPGHCKPRRRRPQR